MANSEKNSSKKNTGKKTKKSSESLKFLAVLAVIFVLILVIYFISRGSEAKNPPIEIENTTTSESQGTNTPEPVIVDDGSGTQGETSENTGTPEAVPSYAPSPTDTPSGTPTETPVLSPTDTPAVPTPQVTIKSAEAKKALETIVDPALYSSTLLAGGFSPNGDGETYYRYRITEIATAKQMTPEILVNAVTASVYCYQDGKVFDCVQFPLDDTEVGGSDSDSDTEITAAEAVSILMTYGRDQLKLQKDPSYYTAKVDDEPLITLVDADGISAYLILLLDTNEKLVGAYAVSVNGIFVYIRDELDPNSFVRITEG